MSESIWYAMYSMDGEPPKCRRLNRLSTDAQLRACIDLAIAHAEGWASYRPYRRRTPGGAVEEWWYWPTGLRTLDPAAQRALELRAQGMSHHAAANACGIADAILHRSASGWWFVPARVVRRAHRLIQAAARAECARGHGSCASDDVVRRLIAWRRNGRWRRRIVSTKGKRRAG